MLNPCPDTGIDSIFNLNTESTSLIDVLVTTIAEPPLLTTTTLLPSPTPLITHLQQTPVPTPTNVPSSSLQDLSNFGSLFEFDHRLKTLETDFSELKQTNQFAASVSSIPGIIDAYLANKMHEAVKTSDQVKEQVKAQVSKILLKIEKTVNEQLEAEVLTRSSNESKTSHVVATNLSELELKKILIDKMESNKPIHRSDEHKNLYKALVDTYESDKLILDTYGDNVSFKRCRDDEDKDEEPSTGSNRGSKRIRAGKEPESTSAPKQKTSKTTGKLTEGSKSHDKSADEPMYTAKDIEEPAHLEFKTGITEDQPDEHTSQLPDCSQAKNADFINKLDDNIKKIIKDQVKEQVKAQVSKILPKIEKIVNEQLEAEVLTRSSNESKTSHAVAANLSELELKKILIDKMESNKSIHRSDEQKNLYKALKPAKPPTPDRDWNKTLPDAHGPVQPWLSSLAHMEDPRESFNELMDTSLDFSAFVMNRLKVDTLTPELLAVPTFELMKGSCKILVELEYLFKEVYKATTNQLDWNNPEVEWHNYKHLDWITVHRDDDKLYTFKEGDFNRLHIQDIEAVLLLLFQGKLTNLTVEERLAFNVSLRMFTRRINKDKKNRFMRIDELHKFSDGTLNDVRAALDDCLKVIRMKYLPQTIWRRSDRDKAGAMIQAIDKQLKPRRIMRSLEKFVGGRPYEGDFRLLQRTI
ncbi:hypothetical protein Tco_1290637 [Tanacetum coccineum]